MSGILQYLERESGQLSSACLVSLESFLIRPDFSDPFTAAALQHVDRIYSNGSSWLFASPKLDWGQQIVLITGGK